MFKAWVTIVVTWVFLNIARALEIDQNVWQNDHVSCTVDLIRSYVRQTCLVEVKNVHKEPQSEYFYSLNDGVRDEEKLSMITFQLDEGKSLKWEEVSENVYKVQLPAPIAPRSTVSLKVQTVFIGGLDPIPEKIGMSDTQTLLLKMNKFFYSPYLTKEYSLTFTGLTKGQEMSVTLPNVEVSENLPDLRPKIENKSLIYGPLVHDIAPYTVQPMGLLYEHNRPISKVHRLERSVWIPGSYVDKLPIEEYYELTHDGAQLSSGFSRVDWMKGRYQQTRNHWALSHLEYPKKSDSDFQDYYFTDKVGVVSTHGITKDGLFLSPRYPMFGGWNYNYTLGWNAKLSKFVHKLKGHDDTYIAKVPIVNTLRDVVYDDVYLTFYLPENAKFLNYSSPLTVDDVNVDAELSYLDVSEGHVKVTLHYKHLFDEINKLNVIIMYSYSDAAYFWKVLKIAGFIFLGLTGYYFLKLVNLSIEQHK